MMNVSVRKNQAGFSLVELMVVVAIIGILASLAIPSIGKYMAKARQSEAKTQLSSLYTAEKAFFAEYTVYDSRFGAIGYSPEGKLRYNVGFTAAGVQATLALNGYNPPAGLNASLTTSAYCIAAGTNGCVMLNGATNAAAPALADTACPATTGAVANCVTSNTTFQAGATAMIHSAAVNPDQWQIDSSKNLQNSIAGIP